MFQSQRMPAYRAAARRLEAMGLALSLLRHPRRDRGRRRRRRARPRRRAALSGALQGPRRGRDRAAQGGRRAVRAAHRHGGCHRGGSRQARGRAAHLHRACRGRRGADRRGRPERWGDAVIVRKDMPTSYHLAVVVDDAWQGVTHVTRGRDLYAATHLHRLLQVLLDLPAPIYHHHRLITDAQRPQARQERARHQPAIAARSGATPGRHPPPGRARLGPPSRSALPRLQMPPPPVRPES